MKYILFFSLILLAGEAFSQSNASGCVIQTVLNDSETMNFLPDSISGSPFSIIQAKRSKYNSDSAECRQRLSSLRTFGLRPPQEATYVELFTNARLHGEVYCIVDRYQFNGKAKVNSKVSLVEKIARIERTCSNPGVEFPEGYISFSKNTPDNHIVTLIEHFDSIHKYLHETDFVEKGAYYITAIVDAGSVDKKSRYIVQLHESSSDLFGSMSMYNVGVTISNGGRFLIEGAQENNNKDFIDRGKQLR